MPVIAKLVVVHATWTGFGYVIPSGLLVEELKMKAFRLLRMTMRLGLGGGLLLGTGPCTGEIFKVSVKEGIFSYISGSLLGGLNNPQFDDFVTDVFTGAFSGGTGGR
jgi:hypothetical protein